MVKNQRWLPEAIFVNGPKPCSGVHNYTTMGTSQANFRKSYQWSRRCDNNIVTVLSNWRLAILKMPYLLTDQNYFRVDTSRH